MTPFPNTKVSGWGVTVAIHVIQNIQTFFHRESINSLFIRNQKVNQNNDGFIEKRDHTSGTLGFILIPKIVIYSHGFLFQTPSHYSNLNQSRDKSKNSKKHRNTRII